MKSNTIFFFLNLIIITLKVIQSSLIPKDFDNDISSKYKTNLEFHFDTSYNPDYIRSSVKFE